MSFSQIPASQLTQQLMGMLGSQALQSGLFLASQDFGFSAPSLHEIGPDELRTRLEGHLENNERARVLAYQFLERMAGERVVRPWDPEAGGDVYERGLRYSAAWPGGNTVILPSKPLNTVVGYSPGIGRVCEAIHEDPERMYELTGRDRTVLIASDSSGVLGYGDMARHAVLGVLHGKGNIAQSLAGLNFVPHLLPKVNAADQESIDRAIESVLLQEPQAGAIMVEDVGTPHCFPLVDQLARKASVPTFQDDQGGTAMVTLSGLTNALEIQGKKKEDCTYVINGAGAAGDAIVKLLREWGVSLDQIYVLDSSGVLHTGRDYSSVKDRHKAAYARKTDLRTLSEVMRGADVFIGVSKKDVVTVEMLKSMAEKPVIFALANPDPEIPAKIAQEARPDAIVATGRSDDPIQINNAAIYPYFVSGALMARAASFNVAMQMAAVETAVQVARQGITADVAGVYGPQNPVYGGWLVFPSLWDSRLAGTMPIAVAEAAIRSGVAQAKNFDAEEQRRRLLKRIRFVQEYSRFLDSWTDGILREDAQR
ncbi:MAG TPA: malic enzyme-like NAD(P)-binding protein [bacterium]|nr:malic enzyme-like NAD(P)-binding protein [bacterium]